MKNFLKVLGGIFLYHAVQVWRRREGKAAEAAEARLHQTFGNLQFEDFGPSPVKGPLYQAVAGGKIIYYAPESETILFAAVYDRNGVNLTALAQDANARKKLGAIDPAQALVIGPPDAPTVIEFTDPELVAIRDRICRRHGWEPVAHRFQVFAESPET